MNSLWFAALLKKGIESELFLPKGGFDIVTAFAAVIFASRKFALVTVACFGSMSKERNFFTPSFSAALMNEPVPPAGSKTVRVFKSGTLVMTSASSLSAKSEGV
jgi:hypothetical protein